MLKLTWIVASLRKRNLRERLILDYQNPLLNTLAASASSTDTQQSMREQLWLTRQQITDTYTLGQKKVVQPEDKDKRVASEAVAAWEEAHGKLSDPETQEKLKALTEGFKKLMEQTAADGGLDALDGVEATQVRQRLQQRVTDTQARNG